MSLLFQIPKDISVYVLSQWSNVDDLGRLDTASCSMEGRSNLLKIFCSPGFDLHGNVTLRGMQFCANKGIALKSIVLLHTDFKAIGHRNVVIDRLNTQKVAVLQIVKNSSYEHSNETIIFCYQLANKCNYLKKVMLIDSFEKDKHVDMFISFLSNAILHNLKVFSSSRSNFGINSCKYLAKHCKLLESLRVDYNDTDIPELEIQSLLICNGSSLKKISFNHGVVSNLTNKTLQCVIDHCPRIKKLSLQYENEVSVSLSLINQLLTKCTTLTDFRVGSNKLASSISLWHLWQPYNNKAYIEMIDPLITNENELVQFFTQVKQNRVIKLITVPLLSATTLNTIALHNSVSLFELVLADCPLITTTDLIKLLKSLPKLTKLTVRCPLVEQREVEKYLETRKRKCQWQ